MKTLKSYYLTILLISVLSILVLLITIFEKFTETIDKNINVLNSYGKYFNYNDLKAKFVSLNAKASDFNIDVQTKDDALESFLKYADFLNRNYKITVKTDRPIDTGDMLTLDVSFHAEFTSEKEFMDFLRKITDSTKPIVRIEKLVLEEENDKNHKAIFDVKLIEPYIRGAQ